MANKAAVSHQLVTKKLVNKSVADSVNQMQT